jgi:ribosome maturation factor RimP
MEIGGKKVQGILKSVDGEDFVVTVQEKVKEEGKKRPVLKDVDHAYNMNQVKYTKYLISFK